MLQVAKSHSCSDGVVQSVSHKRTCVTPSDSESLLVLMPVRFESQKLKIHNLPIWMIWQERERFFLKDDQQLRCKARGGTKCGMEVGPTMRAWSTVKIVKVYKDIVNSRKHERKILWSLVPWHRTTLHERPFVHLPCWRNCFSDAEKSFLGPTSWAPAVSLAFLFVSNVFWAWDVAESWLCQLRCGHPLLCLCRAKPLQVGFAVGFYKLAFQVASASAQQRPQDEYNQWRASATEWQI